MRIIIIPQYSYSYFDLIQIYGTFRIEGILNSDLITILYYYIFDVWGIFLLVFIFFNSKDNYIKWIIKIFGILLCLIYAQVFIATDLGRIIISGFFPITFLSISGMNKLSEKYDIPKSSFFAIGVSYFLLTIKNGYFHTDLMIQIWYLLLILIIIIIFFLLNQFYELKFKTAIELD